MPPEAQQGHRDPCGTPPHHPAPVTGSGCLCQRVCRHLEVRWLSAARAIAGGRKKRPCHRAPEGLGLFS